MKELSAKLSRAEKAAMPAPAPVKIEAAPAVPDEGDAMHWTEIPSFAWDQVWFD